MFFSFEQSRAAIEKSGPLNVLLFETQEASPHLETTLELAQKHLESGDNVTVCYWNKCLPYREPWGPFLAPELMNLAFDRGCRRLEGSPEILTELAITDEVRESLRRESDVLQFDSIEELKNFTWRDLDLGMAVTSSIVSRLKDPNIDLAKHDQLVCEAIFTFMLCFESTKAFLASADFDLVYLFNGRFCATRGILRAVQQSKVKFRIQERGCNTSKYCLMTDVPHDRRYIQKYIRRLWEAHQTDAEARVKAAREFFDDRRRGEPQCWPSFTDHQHAGVPEELSSKSTLISYFSSSDDEYIAVGDAFDQQGFSTQAQAIQALIDAIATRGDMHLVIRVHPHLRHKAESYRRFWEQLPVPHNCTIIPADSPVSSYGLIDASDLVVTYGSTVGIEATYYAKPSLLLGSAEYDNLDVCNRAFTAESIVEFISKPSDWVVHDQVGVHMYGFYQNMHGVPFEYYKAEGFFSGTFKGVNLFAAAQLPAEPARLHGDDIRTRVWRKFRKTLSRARALLRSGR